MITYFQNVSTEYIVRAFFKDNPEFEKDKRIGIIDWWFIDITETAHAELEDFVANNDFTIFISRELLFRATVMPGDALANVLGMFGRYNVACLLLSQEPLMYRLNLNRTMISPWFSEARIYTSPEFVSNFEYTPKPYDFNLLLGLKKPFRSLLFHGLFRNPRIYATYYGHNNIDFHEPNNDILNTTDIIDTLYENRNYDTSDHTALRTMVPVQTGSDGKGIHFLSHVVPENIYRHSHFDIVAETHYYENFYQATEKTAKPLLTARPFIWVAAPGFKDYLKRFDIDLDIYEHAFFDGERYDQLSFVRKLELLFDAVHDITTSRSRVKDIYDKTKEARQHNQETIKKIITTHKTHVHQFLHCQLTGRY